VKRFLSLCAALLLLLSPFALAGCGSASKSEDVKTVKIGMIGPLSGPAAEAGNCMKQGAQLAMDEWNAKEGVNIGGKKVKVEILFEDSQSKPEVGVSLGEKLISRDKVHVLIGESFHSSVTLAVMELAPKYGIPIYSIQPVSDEISKKVASDPKKYATFWKGDFGNDNFGKAAFETYKYLTEKGLFTPKTKSIAFLVEDTDYGRSLTTVMKGLFEGAGWKTVASETVPLNHTDFYPQLNKIKSAKPDILLTVFTPLASGVALVKQFQEVGMTASHFGITFPRRPEFSQQAGKSAEGLLWSPLMFDPDNIDKQKPLSNKIKEKFNVVATSDHAFGYDAINNILDAVNRAGTIKGDVLSEAIGKTDREGLLGRYVFDPKDHSAKGGVEYLPVPAVQIVDGKHYIIWPDKLAKRQYTPQPWVK